MSYVLGSVDRTASDFVANFNVKRGSTGPKVLFVQTALNVFGAKPSLKVDSIFGPLTEAAVRGFQEANGLVVDGVVGPQTSEKLQDDEAAEIGSKKSTTLPVTTVPKLPKKSNMLLIGGIVVAGVIGVAIALGGGSGKTRKNPGRGWRRRVQQYMVWVKGSKPGYGSYRLVHAASAAQAKNVAKRTLRDPDTGGRPRIGDVRLRN